MFLNVCWLIATCGQSDLSDKCAQLTRELNLVKEQRRMAEAKALEAQERMFAAQMIGSAGDAMRELEASKEEARKARVAVQIANVAAIMGLDVGSIAAVALRVWKHKSRNAKRLAAEQEHEKVCVPKVSSILCLVFKFPRCMS